MSSVAMESREANRLRILQLSGLLDSPPEKIFDRLTELAAKAIGVPVVLMSLVDADRQFFKSQTGLPEPWAGKRETPLSHSFCQFVSASNEPLIVEDAREYPLVCDNLAVRDLNVIAYSGVPLTTGTGETLGSLCAIDTKPRSWTREEIDILEAIASQMMHEVNLRLQIGELSRDLSERGERVRQNVHDLRTPVTSVLVSLDAVAMAGSLNETQSDFLAMAKRNARVLIDLVNEILKVGNASREMLDALECEPCSPEEMVHRAIEQVEPLADRAGISLNVLPAKAPKDFEGDKAELIRVLVNLLANAVKFTPRGRSVMIGAEQTNGSGPVGVRFTVMDEGIGIASEDQPLLFQEGGRLDRHADSRFSTGIGLAYCKRIVEAHGGRIDVRSAPGAGSTFSFFIPSERPSRPQPTEAHALEF